VLSECESWGPSDANLAAEFSANSGKFFLGSFEAVTNFHTQTAILRFRCRGVGAVASHVYRRRNHAAPEGCGRRRTRPSRRSDSGHRADGVFGYFGI